MTTVAEQFANARRAFAGEPCLLTPEGWLTFEQAGTAADGARSVLADSGGVVGDRVVLALPNSAVLRILEQGVLEAGLVRVAVSPRLHAREIAAIADDAGARVVCCDPGAFPALRAAVAERGIDLAVLACADTGAPLTPRTLQAAAASAPPAASPAPDDLAMLLYSSGTTGRPKGATVTHRSWVEQWRRAMRQLPPVGPGDIVLAAAPMTHFAGSIGLDCAAAGAATVPLVYSGPTELLAALDRHGPTILPLAPVMLAELAATAGPEHEAALSLLRTVPYGGSSIATAHLVAATRLLPGLLVQFYGLAEALAPLAVLSPQEHDEAVRLLAGDAREQQLAADVLSSAGRWVDGVEARTERDELVVAGGVVTSGYWRREELNRTVFSDGWFTTGDLVRFDDGRLTILSRADDVVVSGGFNIYPGEVERVLAAEPGLRDVAVVGLPHPRWGHGIVAAVVLDDAHDERYAGDDGRARLLAALVARTRASLAGYKKPLDVHILPDLPRNAAGKLDRNRLRERLSAPESDHHAST